MKRRVPARQSLLAIPDVTVPEAISLASRFAKVDLRHVQTTQVPYADERGLPGLGDVLISSESKKRALVQRMLFRYDSPAAGISIESEPPQGRIRCETSRNACEDSKERPWR